MSLQSIVERKHFLKRSKTLALTNTVMETWNSTDLNDMLHKVFNRLKEFDYNDINVIENEDELVFETEEITI